MPGKAPHTALIVPLLTASMDMPILQRTPDAISRAGVTAGPAHASMRDRHNTVNAHNDQLTGNLYHDHLKPTAYTATCTPPRIPTPDPTANANAVRADTHNATASSNATAQHHAENTCVNVEGFGGKSGQWTGPRTSRTRTTRTRSNDAVFRVSL